MYTEEEEEEKKGTAVTSISQGVKRAARLPPNQTDKIM